MPTLGSTAIPSTVERVFGLPALNRRDAWGNGVNHLAVLKTARADAPTTLPAVGKARVSLARAELGAKPATRPNDLVAADPEGNAPAMVRLALHQHLQVSPPAEHVAILARARAIQTRGQALDYVREVRQRIHTKRLQMRATVPA